MPLLYLLADALYIVAYHIMRYRRDVVSENLRHAFPEKSESERSKIAREFYRHLADLVMETIKILAISSETLNKRCTIADNEDSRHYFTNNKGALLFTAHFGNWEWAGTVVGLQTQRPFQVIFRKLHDKNFDYMMRKIRGRFGNEPVPMDLAFKKIVEKRDQGVVTAFVADQKPLHIHLAYWTPLMNRLAPFYTGPEKIARKLKVPVYFGRIHKSARGRYETHLELMTQDASLLPENALMEMYARKLEEALYTQPHTWLWSHRRWKHTYDPAWQKRPDIAAA